MFVAKFKAKQQLQKVELCPTVLETLLYGSYDEN